MTDALKLLEFPELLALLERYIASPLGGARLEAVTPGAAREAAEARLALAAEAREFLRPQERAGPSDTPSHADGGAPAAALPLSSLSDPEPLLAKLSIEGVVLELAEVAELLRLAEAASESRRALLSLRRQYPRLARVADGLGDFQALLREWRGRILPNGELDERASPQLQRIRREMERQRGVILTSLRSLTRSLADDSAQEEIVTVRGDRFVVPVRVGKRSQVKGVVHGSSSSGQTVYMEPLEAIDLNNELVRLREEEAQEIHRILRAMTAGLRERAADLAASAEALGVLDLAMACGRFARDFDCSIPVFNVAGAPARLHLKAARHPLLEALFRAQGKGMKVVPVSLELDGERRVLVISGPNTGGKTVALKTVGLLAMMALAGLPVPAVEAEFPFFDRVLADIGDSQSIQESLSTFSAHLMNIASMMAGAAPDSLKDSLILLDELGSATDPEEAGALAVAIVDRFRALGSFTLASTHHTVLKAYAANTPGVVSANMGFDEQTLAPTYHLEVGRPGQSSGIAIAERLGLPTEVVARARQALSAAHREVEGFLSRLKADAEAASQMRADLESRLSAQDQREREWSATQHQREMDRAAQWERQLEELFRTLEERAEQKLQELSAQASRQVTRPLRPQEVSRKAVQAADRLRENAKDELRQTLLAHLGGGAGEGAGGGAAAPPLHLPVAPRKAGVGDTVKIKSLGRSGVVRGKSGDWLEVEVGHLRTRVRYEDIEEVIPGLPQGATPPQRSSVSVKMEGGVREGSLSEINVIGENAEEARRRVDKFLDNAYLAALSRVRVVHGHGKGILRKSLAEMFAEHPHVEKFSIAPQEEGGAGATIVELKQ